MRRLSVLSVAGAALVSAGICAQVQSAPPQFRTGVELRFRTQADSPDLLHPGDAGYQLMAEAIDLAIFTRPVAVR